MKLSIIITTFNRSLQLGQLLEDLVFQLDGLKEEETQEIEVILVDNNSNDDTKEVAYQYTESALLNMRYYSESKRGVSPARNFGVRQAKGDLVAFLDDDLNLDEDWLKEAFRLANICKDKEIGVYGGRIIPLWQERVPPWLNTDPPNGIEQEVFTSHNAGESENFYPIFIPEINSKQIMYPLGTNVMIRREIFENCGYFREDIGINSAGGLGLHEDKEFFEYLSTLQIPMVYVPQCTAFHPIDSEQLEKQNIRRWYYKSGRSAYWIAHTDRVKSNPDPWYGINPKYKFLFPNFTSSLKIAGAPLYLYLKVVFLFMVFLFMHITLNKKKIFWHSLQFSRAIGELDGSAIYSKYLANKKFTFKDKLEAKQYSLKES